MKIFNLISLFSVTFASLLAQDYKPYKPGQNNNGYNSYKTVQDENTADGFFDNYVNLYDGDPNVAIVEKNKAIKQEQEKLLREKEAILLSLDSLAVANQKEEKKISGLKNDVIQESAVKKSPRKSNTSKSQDDDYEIVYERKIVRRASTK